MVLSGEQRLAGRTSVRAHDPLGDLVEWVASRLEDVVLRYTIDEGEQKRGLELRLGGSGVTEVPRERRANLGRPARQAIPERREDGRLHARPVREAPEGAVLAHDAHARPHERLEPILRVWRGVRLGERLAHVAHALLEDRAEELLLALEVVVDEPRRHAGRLGDRLHRGALETLRAEQLERVLDDERPALLAEVCVDGFGAWRHVRPGWRFH